MYLTPGNELYSKDNWKEYPPGEAIYYSSLGYELLALIVDHVSDTSFKKYCQNKIFKPLCMTNTSFLISDINQSLLASIYCHLPGLYIPLPFYQKHNTGAGGMLSTIEDLSNYAQIHLNNGTYQNTTILGEETL